MAPFRSMLLTLQSGLKSFAPRARWVPVYPVVFLTFLHAAYTAHEAIAPGHPCGATLAHADTLVQTALRRAAGRSGGAAGVGHTHEAKH